MAFTTYSFADISCIITHPALGQHTVVGSGAKSISISRLNDSTSHDLAADGSVLVSKMASPNGNIIITAHQTSPLNQFLTKMANYIKTAPSSEFAAANIVVRAPNMKKQITSIGVSIQKIPDENFEAAGGTVAWTLMAASITNEVI